MMDLTVRVEGLEQVQKTLEQAGPTLAQHALGRALAAGAAVFVDLAKSKAPVLATATAHRQPGELRDSIDAIVRVRDHSGIARTGISQDRTDSQSPAVYGLFVEYGSVHGKAQPYMRPAFESGVAPATAAFITEIQKGINDLGK